MLDAPRSGRWTALAAAVGFALACGGGGGRAEQVPDIDFAPVPAPEQQPDAEAEGLAGELSLPIGNAMVRKNEDKAVDLLFPSAFDASEPFRLVREHLEGLGYTGEPVDPPPFAASLAKEGRRIELTAERAGSSVWIRVRAK